MRKQISFAKMQGAGNDYVYVNGFDQEILFPEKLSQWVSNRHFGVGSDGLVLILPSETCDFRMRMFNADGTEAEMCGNATRCVGKYVYDKGLTAKREITLETKAGVKHLELFTDERNRVVRVRVDMGAPVLEAYQIPVISEFDHVIDEPVEVNGAIYRMSCVSMGNPHAVIFVPDVAGFDLEKWGPAFENHPRFPRRTNTEFVEVVSPGELKMRVWERGAGETLACGTGACASLVAAVLNHKSDRKATLKLSGGDLEIEWNPNSNRILMSGPAEFVFEGSFEWND
ncbi:MAG: diaminopimelate epimerase [Bacteroidales bacterium]